MPYTTLGKNLMLDALRGTNPSAPITHIGALSAGTPITGVTGTASTDLLNKSGHGLANGDLVVLTELTGGTGLVAGDAGNANEGARPYFVVGVSGNDFQVALTPGGTAVDFTTNVTALTVTKLTEVSGGSPAYARKSIAFNAAAAASMDDSTNGAVLDIPPLGKVSYLSYHSAVSAGTLLAIDKVVEETFGGQGTYTVTDADLDLLATA